MEVTWLQRLCALRWRCMGRGPDKAEHGRRSYETHAGECDRLTGPTGCELSCSSGRLKGLVNDVPCHKNAHSCLPHIAEVLISLGGGSERMLNQDVWRCGGTLTVIL